MKILFQGDSITDAGRDRSDPHDLGNGYPKYASAMIADAHPELEFEFFDLGISGNRSVDLLGRMERDIIEIDPDIVSILIGVNDVWHRHSHGKEMSDEQFEAYYREILGAIKEKTHAKILMMTPFLLYAPEKEIMRAEVERIAAIVKRLAKEYADAFLPLDEKFAQALSEAPAPDFYSGDGVHPNAEGAAFIGELYLHTVAPLLASEE
jgi:lysophospholipase L1-like esterase